MVIAIDSHRIAFCQVTKSLPSIAQEMIWNLALDPTFESWMESINNLLLATHGVEVSDMPDEPFRDYYDDNLTHEEVVTIMVEDNIFM